MGSVRAVAIALLGAACWPADARMSQSALEDDCLRRLRTLMTREVKVQAVDFSAIGNYANYYVVRYRFSGALENGRQQAACTYRRDGDWVGDDAAAHRALLELEAKRRLKPQ